MDALRRRIPFLRPLGRFGVRFTNVADRARCEMTLNNVSKLFSRGTGHGNAARGTEREGSEAERRDNESRKSSKGAKREMAEARQWGKGKGGSRLY